MIDAMPDDKHDMPSSIIFMPHFSSFRLPDDYYARRLIIFFPRESPRVTPRDASPCLAVAQR